MFRMQKPCIILGYLRHILHKVYFFQFTIAFALSHGPYPRGTRAATGCTAVAVMDDASSAVRQLV